MQKEITIAGLLFPVTVPFAEGHILTEAEAKQLNQVRAENVRNNTASAVKKLASEDGTFTPEAVAEAAELVAKYDAEYVFTIGGAGARRVTDPLEKECLAIARAHVTATIKASGKKVKDFDEAKIEAKVEELAAHPDVIKAAKARLRDREKLSEALAIDLSEPAAAE